MTVIVAVQFKRESGIKKNNNHGTSENLSKHSSYFIKSVYSIQKTPSLLPWAINSWRKC